MFTDPIFLYVEDDALSRRVMEMLLIKGLGYQQVTIFEDTSHFEARLKALSPVPNIILLDIHMQPLNGFQVLELIRQNADFSHAKVVAVTASVMSEEVEMLKTVGFDGGIAKPIDPTTFSEAIAHIMQGKDAWYIT